MIELFPGVSEEVKKLISYCIDLAFLQPTPLECAKVVNNFRKSCRTEEEKDFLDFYFNLRLELLNNEGDNNELF
jgi:hypothetical protein